MIIKKFQAPTENEAMLQVKEEMGSDAVIMNIKKTTHRGIMSLFKPTVVEVTAALEESATPTKAQTAEGANTATVDLVADEPVKINVGEVKPKYDPNHVIMDEPEEGPKEKQSSEDTTAIEEKLNNLQSMLEKQMKKEKEDSVREVKESEETSLYLKYLKSSIVLSPPLHTSKRISVSETDLRVMRYSLRSSLLSSICTHCTLGMKHNVYGSIS